MSIIEEYHKLPSPLKSQLNEIYREFSSNTNVKDCYRKLMSELPKKLLSRIAERSMERSSEKYDKALKILVFHLAILKTISPFDMLKPIWFSKLYCYSDHSDHLDIYLNTILKTGQHASVFEAVMGKKPVIVKFYQSTRRNITYEINIYNRIKEMGCKVPWFSSCYYVWNCPVLVMEKLSSLSKSDDEYRVGYEVLKQLWRLHTFAIHSDIKPQNIMKRKTGSKCQYLLIDYGGVAMEPLEHGYRRWVWSRKWTSQIAHESKQIVTAKNDFLELGYTMRALQVWRKPLRQKSHDEDDEDEFKRDFEGKLVDYMERVELIEDHNIKKRDYVDLLRILHP